MLFENSPIDLIEDKNFDKRELYTIDIHWECDIPGGGTGKGRKYRQWKLAKPHVEYIIFLMGVMSTDELFKIKTAIAEGLVPDFFSSIVDEFYQAKIKSGYILSIRLTNTPLFDYNDHKKFDVPKEPTFKSRGGLIGVVPQIHPRIPVATNKHIENVLNKR